MQLKFSAVEKAQGGLTIPAQGGGERVHVEDFAQVFGVFPEAKYQRAFRAAWAERQADLPISDDVRASVLGQLERVPLARA